MNNHLSFEKDFCNTEWKRNDKSEFNGYSFIFNSDTDNNLDYKYKKYLFDVNDFKEEFFIKIMHNNKSVNTVEFIVFEGQHIKPTLINFANGIVSLTFRCDGISVM